MLAVYYRSVMLKNLMRPDGLKNNVSANESGAYSGVVFMSK
jgi:hypothetical protein